MRWRLLSVGALLVAVTAAYIASPFLAAYNLRHAAKTGDSATLANAVDWPSVRSSLKVSLAELQTQPAPATTQHGMPRAPSIWTRIKAIAAPALIESFIERYATPEGVTQAMSLRDGWRNTVKPAIGGESATTALASTIVGGSALDRAWTFYSRIKRAEFVSPSTVEFEVADRQTPERRFISRLALDQWQWKLVSVRVVGVGF